MDRFFGVNLAVTRGLVLAWLLHGQDCCSITTPWKKDSGLWIKHNTGLAIGSKVPYIHGMGGIVLLINFL